MFIYNFECFVQPSFFQEYTDWLIDWLVNWLIGRNKCICSSSHALCYGHVRSCAVRNSSALCCGMPFVLITLKRLNVSDPEYWVTWSWTHFYLCYRLHEIGNCFLLKHFLRKLKDFCLTKSVLWWEIWNLLKFDGWQKKHFCFKPNSFLKEYCY